jgi:hypothetical protein
MQKYERLAVFVNNLAALSTPVYVHPYISFLDTQGANE